MRFQNNTFYGGSGQCLKEDHIIWYEVINIDSSGELQMTVHGSVLNFKLTGVWLVWHMYEIFGNSTYLLLIATMSVYLPVQSEQTYGVLLAPMYNLCVYWEVWNSLHFFFRRGLTPPHRVKSISMASFSPEEVELIKSRGNDVSNSCFIIS